MRRTKKEKPKSLMKSAPQAIIHPSRGAVHPLKMIWPVRANSNAVFAYEKSSTYPSFETGRAINTHAAKSRAQISALRCAFGASSPEQPSHEPCKWNVSPDSLPPALWRFPPRWELHRTLSERSQAAMFQLYGLLPTMTITCPSQQEQNVRTALYGTK